MPVPLSPEAPAGFLHLGDSYTCCEGVPAPEGWPARLHAAFMAKRSPMPAPVVMARTGWSSGELLEAFTSSDLLKRRFALVTLCIGVNNQYRGLALPELEADIRSILKLCGPMVSDQPSRIWILSIPDWAASPFASGRDRGAIGKDIDAHNALLRKISLVARHPFHDWTPLSRSFLGQSDAFAADGLHPSGNQYAAWSAGLEGPLCQAMRRLSSVSARRSF